MNYLSSIRQKLNSSGLKKTRKIILANLLLFALITSACFSSLTPKSIVQADNTTTTSTPPARETTIKVSYTLYTWWLIKWSDNQAVCTLQVNHDGVPVTDEIANLCSNDVLNQWLATKSCIPIDPGSNTSQCSGLYAYFVSSKSEDRSVSVKLASPSVDISLVNCGATTEKDYCMQLPSLQLTGNEPLPNENIIQIEGILDGKAFSCPGATCTLPLSATSMNGISLSFWAESSFGDASEHYTAMVRVIPWENFSARADGATGEPRWFVDVISSQWEGKPLASCSTIWSSFPPIGGPSTWLSTPSDPSQLTTFTSYYFLAGSLILNGKVDARDCPDGGLNAQRVANECGLQKAMPAVLEWQNQFNNEIIQVADDTNVPAQLMKNFFSRESQFWPGIFQTDKESGFGQLTVNGADTTLLWNSDFFNQFCPLVFKTQYCKGGYNTLTQDQQETLKGALLQNVNATCTNCAYGIDLSQANASIKVFANSLLANCAQVEQIIYNLTNTQAGNKSSYEDLWKFTLVNYNAGAGCLTSAIQTAMQQNQALNWKNVSGHLEPACQGAIQYVNDISQDTAGP